MQDEYPWYSCCCSIDLGQKPWRNHISRMHTRHSSSRIRCTGILAPPPPLKKGIFPPTVVADTISPTVTIHYSSIILQQRGVFLACCHVSFVTHIFEDFLKARASPSWLETCRSNAEVQSLLQSINIGERRGIARRGGRLHE